MAAQPIEMRDIYWLAGLLEGEGCFTLTNRTAKTWTPHLKINTTDQDVAERAGRILGRAAKGPYDQGLGNKVYFSVAINGNLAIQWMMTIYSLMGERRRERVEEILAVWRAGDYRKSRAIHRE